MTMPTNPPQPATSGGKRERLGEIVETAVCQSTIAEILYAQAPGEPRWSTEADILADGGPAVYANVPVGYNEDEVMCLFCDDDDLEAAEAAIRAAAAEAIAKAPTGGFDLVYADSSQHEGYILVAAMPDETPAEQYIEL